MRAQCVGRSAASKCEITVCLFAASLSALGGSERDDDGRREGRGCLYSLGRCLPLYGEQVDGDPSCEDALQLAARWASLDLERRRGVEGAPAARESSPDFRRATAEMLGRGLLSPSGPDAYVLTPIPSVTWKGKPPYILVAVCLVGALLAPLVGWGAAIDPTSGLGPSLLIVGLAAAPVLLTMAVRASLRRVHADPSGITITTMFGRRLISWSDLLDSRFNPTHDGQSGELCGYTYDFMTRQGVKGSRVPYRDTKSVSEQMRRDRALLLAMRDAATHTSPT